jgi:uncharacterized protein (TIGR03083 family)
VASRPATPHRRPKAASSTRQAVDALASVGYLGGVDYRSILLDETHSFGDLVRNCDPSTLVPTCPGWTVRELFHHVGRGHRWAAQIVATRAVAAPDPRFVPEAEPPGEGTGGIDWLVDGAAVLVDAVTRTGLDTAVWTILGPRPAWWWLRRRAFDTLVHAVDAAMAQGVQHRMSAHIAAEALTEWLERVAAQADTSSAPLRPGQRLSFQATDIDHRWTVSGTQTGVTWTPEQGPGDVMLRGPMTDLLLAAVRRRRLDETGITVVGDAAVWQVWVDNTPFESSQNRSISAMSTTEISSGFDAARPNPGASAP